ncbi:MAG: hypothetical protein AB7J40_03070 [Candidatus Altimarinota bacterium]
MKKQNLFALVAVGALSLSTMGCLASPNREPESPIQATATVQQPPTQQPSQQFGQNPQGFVADPSNPNKGFVSVGGSMIAVTRGVNGWEAAQTNDSQPRSIMDTTPGRYDPMVTFLERHNLSLRDWNTLGNAYNQTEILDQLGRSKVNYLRSVDEHVQNTQIQDLGQAVQGARQLRTLHNQFNNGY